MIGVYKITNRITGGVYVGQSKDIDERFLNHKNQSKKGVTLIAKSLREYGIENHLFEVIEECGIDELDSKERYYQELNDCIGETGLNGLLQGTNDKTQIVSSRTIECRKRTFVFRRLKKNSF